jgi:CheY-like chemotaxis protein
MDNLGDNPADNHGALVLIVDDVEAIVDELLTFLLLQGIPAIGAGTLGEAVEILENSADVRVIACDVRLHGESGLDIIPLIRNHGSLQGRNFRYVFITGDPMYVDIPATEPGYRVLTKPVQPRALHSLLKALLEDSPDGRT